MTYSQVLKVLLNFAPKQSFPELLRQLNDLRTILKNKPTHRMYAASLLIVYDARKSSTTSSSILSSSFSPPPPRPSSPPPHPSFLSPSPSTLMHFLSSTTKTPQKSPSPSSNSPENPEEDGADRLRVWLIDFGHAYPLCSGGGQADEAVGEGQNPTWKERGDSREGREGACEYDEGVVWGITNLLSIFSHGKWDARLHN